MIDCKPQLGIDRVGGQLATPEELSVIPHIARHVLPIAGIGRITPGSIQRGKPKALSIESIGKTPSADPFRASAGSYSDVVVLAGLEYLDEPLDQRWINQRAICRDANYWVSFKSLCGPIVTIQDVVFAARKKRDLIVVAELTQNLIGPIHRNRHYHFIDRRHRANPVDDVPQHGLAQDWHEYLAGQPI